MDFARSVAAEKVLINLVLAHEFGADEARA
jgi:hypothetical protein